MTILEQVQSKIEKIENTKGVRPTNIALNKEDYENFQREILERTFKLRGIAHPMPHERIALRKELRAAGFIDFHGVEVFCKDDATKLR